jgi:hypothetical protein
MKRLISILFLFTLVFYSGICAAADVDIKTQMGFNYDWWDDSKDNKARQFFIPMSLEARYRDLSFRVLTAEANTHIDPVGSPSRSLTHLLDTKVNLSYEILGKLPVDILIGLDFNLPTGKSNLKERDQVLLMDPDLVTITNFGEGFNVNPTVSIAKEWGNWVVGVGFGYVWRGEYDFRNKVFEWTHDMGPIAGSQSFYTKDYNPGDILNANAEVRYYFSPNWNARFFGLYTWYTKDKVDSLKFYQEGDFLLLGLGLYYNQKKWDAGFTLRSIFRDKSKFKEEVPAAYASPSELYARWRSLPLSTEDQNSHGDEWVADLSLRYFLNDKTTIKSFLQGLLITKNDYPSNSPRFIGQREKISLGLGLQRKLFSYFEGEFYAKGFLMHDEERFFPEFLSERSYRGFSAGLQLISRF